MNPAAGPSSYCGRGPDMGFEAELLTGLAGLVVLALAVEVFFHRRRLRKIPIRVHVNGTRGKSSVTRLIAAGLRAGGKRVIAKTTGTLARVILPNGFEVSVYRPLGANVREQIRIVRLAHEHEAEVLLLECMALQPALQWLSEKMFVQATHGVITNARPDHLDVMGPGPTDVAKALAGMVPRRGLCFTTEAEHLDVFREAARDRSSELVALGSDEIHEIGPEMLEGFEYFEHPDNLALALRVCEELGVSSEVALPGMWQAKPDPGAMVFCRVEYFGRDLVFVNAFAANDPVSSEQIWRLCLERFPDHLPVALFNCRVDRADRSRQLGESLASWQAPEHVVVVGSGTVFFARSAATAGFDVQRLINLEGSDARDTFERLIELSAERTLIVGLGNIGGLGLDLVRQFRVRSKPRRAMVPEPSKEAIAESSP